jgi:multidrug efflux system membrane fusion protein
MASRIFKPSRVVAVVLVLAAATWIASRNVGPFAEEEVPSEVVAPAAQVAQIPVQRVGVATAGIERHQQQIVLSCVTQADRRAKAVARGGGVIIELKVKRGSTVAANETIATISDEGREAAVRQAQALLDQRLAEYEAIKRLIDQGNAPRNQLPALEAAVAAARGAVATAQAESDRASVNSPIDGIVDSVPLQVGQAVQAGSEIATIVDPDPMLAVGAVSESRRGSIKVGQRATVRFIDGSMVEGSVSFVGLSADKATRTYPVEAVMANPNAAIADGVTCEMAVLLEPIMATAVPRSALVFADDGRLGVRTVDAAERAAFVPVEVVDDGREVVWVTGLPETSRLIVVGQDFVKDGDPVEAVTAAEATVSRTGAPA